MAIKMFNAPAVAEGASSVAFYGNKSSETLTLTPIGNDLEVQSSGDKKYYNVKFKDNHGKTVLLSCRELGTEPFGAGLKVELKAAQEFKTEKGKPYLKSDYTITNKGAKTHQIKFGD